MSASTWAIVLVGGLLTFLQRLAFLAVAHRATELPPRVRDALRMIPPAALAALVFPAVLREGPGGPLALADPPALAAVAAMAVMWRTRSVLATLAVGMGLLIGLQQILG